MRHGKAELGEAAAVAGCSPADFSTDLIDLSEVPLLELRSLHTDELDDAIDSLVVVCQRGTMTDSVQEQR